MAANDTPDRLFKYCVPQRSDVLRNGTLRYSPLGAFNDPFEGRPEITGLSTDDEAARSFRTGLVAEATQAYGNLDPQVREAISLPQFLHLMKSFYETNEPAILAQFQSFAPLVEKVIQAKLAELVGALCLSEVPDSLLMWSHYGESHAGFVIEFDGSHKYFDERRSPEDELRHLRRVLYRDTRPSAPLSGMSGNEVFLVKSGHWAYEREWRILRPLPEADVVIPGDRFPIHLFRFPQEAVTAVILGARIAPEIEQTIRCYLRETPGLAAARLRRARPDSSHFLLRIVDEAI